MIHDILLSFPNNNLNSDLNLKDVISDTIIYNVTVDGLDLSSYKIRAEVSSYGNTIQLGNLAAGGSDDEIIDADTESGMSAFQIIVAKDLTKGFLNYGTLEIEIEDTNGYVYTILQQRITFIDENIDWTIPA
jgi:hypothetical protein